MGYVGVEIERAFGVAKGEKLGKAIAGFTPQFVQQLIAEKVYDVIREEPNLSGFMSNGAHCYLDGDGTGRDQWLEQSTPPAPNGGLATLYLRAEDLRLQRALPEASARVSDVLRRTVRIKAMDLAADAHGNSRAFHINLSCETDARNSTVAYYVPMVMHAAKLFEGGKVVPSHKGLRKSSMRVPEGKWYAVARSSKAVWPLGEAVQASDRVLGPGEFGLVWARTVERTVENGPCRMEIRWFGRGFGEQLTALTLDWLRLALDYTEEMVRQGREQELHTVDNVWTEWRRVSGTKRDVPMALLCGRRKRNYTFDEFNEIVRRNFEEVLTITPERRRVLTQWDALTRAIKTLIFQPTLK